MRTPGVTSDDALTAETHAVRRHGVRRASELSHLPAGALSLRRAGWGTTADERRPRSSMVEMQRRRERHRRDRTALRGIASHGVPCPGAFQKRIRLGAAGQEVVMVTTAESGNQVLVEQLSRLDGARMRAYRDNLSFYQGQQWATNGAPPRAAAGVQLRQDADRQGGVLPDERPQLRGRRGGWQRGGEAAGAPG